MLGARRPFPAPAPARRKAPARDRPYLGRDTAPPRGGRRWAATAFPAGSSGARGWLRFWGRCLCPSQPRAPQQRAQSKGTWSMSSARPPKRANALTQTPKLKQIKPERPETALQQTAGQLRAVLRRRVRRPPIPSAPAESRNVTVIGVAPRGNAAAAPGAMRQVGKQGSLQRSPRRLPRMARSLQHLYFFLCFGVF